MQKPAKDAQYFLFGDTTISTRDNQNETNLSSDEFINKMLIRYFQQSHKQVKDLVNSIRLKEPLLM
jgi:hypothetical protein